MAKPNGTVKNLKTPDNVTHEIIPDRLGNNGYVATPPTLTADSTLALTSDIKNPTITFTQGGTTKGTITLNQSSNQTIAFDAGGGGSQGLETLTSPVELTTLSDGVYKLPANCALQTNGNTKTTISGTTSVLSITTNGSVRNLTCYWYNQVMTAEFTNSGSYQYQETYNLSNFEDKTNKVISLSSSSTDTQYPSAKATYDYVKDTVSNPNLLINGDFQVNQRGNSSYSHSGGGWKYTVDRWRIGVGGSFNTSSQVVTLNNTGSFDQALPIDEIGYLKGREVTFSIYINGLTGSGVFTIYDGVSTSTETLQNGLNVLTKTLSASMTILRCLVNNNSGSSMSFIPVYAKLELGSVATPFSPRPYAEELNMCQRYYQVQKGNPAIGVGQANTSNIAISTGSLITAMRIAPTISWGGTFLCRSGNGYYTVSSISANYGNSTLTYQLQYTISSNSFTVGRAVDIFIDSTNPQGYLEFDAEFY